MKMLFDDVIESASFSSLNQNQNYPASNLGHEFLYKRYQCLETTDTITITLAEVSDIDCIFYGFHTISSLVIRFYDSSDNLLSTVTVSSPESYGSQFFTSVPDVAEIQLDLAGSAGFYLGKFSAGPRYDGPDVDPDFDEPLSDNSITNRSAGGQTISTLITPFEGLALSISTDQPRSEWTKFRDLYKSVGKGKGVWIDAFEEDHSFKSPFYGSFPDEPKRTREDPDKYHWNFSLQENR